MDELKATFRIVTPLFLGDAKQSPDDGIRPPSFKGVLRFWWRALNWGRFRTVNGADNISALKELHKEEAQLFGLAAKTIGGKQVGGQGAFLLTVQHEILKITEKGKVSQKFKPSKRKQKNENSVIDENHLAATRYLAYGLMAAFTSKNKETGVNTPAGQLNRGCMEDDQIFTVTLTFRDKIDNSVLNALKALGLLGGLGSRSRHGMGSIALEKIVINNKEEAWTLTDTPENYKERVENLIGDLAIGPEPDYSAFSKESRVDILLSSDTASGVLEQFGTAMLKYRSWGKNDRVLGLPSEKRFEDDHSWCKNLEESGIKWRAKFPSFHPARVVFGLPHNYGNNKNMMVNAEKLERRASPLFFHVHRLSDKLYIGVSVLLKSRFLPNSEKINAGGTLVDQDIKWSLLNDFLDGKIGNPPTTNDRFPVPHKKAVLP